MNQTTKALALLIALSASLTHADSGKEQVPIGPRPLALGGAFAAVAEGTDAIYWNPAGLGKLRISSVRFTNAELHGLGIQDNVVTFVTPMWRRLGVGLEWYHSGYDDEVLKDSVNRFSLALGWQPATWISLGAGIKHNQYSQTFEPLDQGHGSGFGVDLGAVVEAHRMLTIGLMCRDVGGSTLEFDDGSTGRPYDPELVFGIAGRPHKSILLSMDVGWDYRVGGEVRVFDELTLRGGWSKDLSGSGDQRMAMGVALGWGPAHADYTYHDHSTLDATHHFGVGLDFTLAPKLVEIQGGEIQPIFASFYKSYASDPPARILVKNLRDVPLEIQVQIAQAQLLDEAPPRSFHLLPGVVQEIALPIVFPERFGTLEESKPVDFELRVSYQSSGRRRTETQALQAFVYERGTLSWGDGVGRAAAFVTPTHTMVDAFTRRLVRLTASMDTGFLNRTTLLAMRLFDGMSACGITYVADPLNPYVEVGGNPSAIDRIQYPAELLVARTGDCDDTTVLYASMLSNVGIRSALLDVPGHIFLMFDTGIHTRDRDALGVDPARFVEHEGTLWIPVETTSTGKAFHVAWDRGVDLVQAWKDSDRFHIVDLQKARQRYEAAVSAAHIGEQVSGPEIDSLRVVHFVAGDVERLQADRERYTESSYAANRAGHLRLARVRYMNHDYLGARQSLELVPESERDAGFWNNLGDVQVALGQVEDALESFSTAHELDGQDPGIALNRGIALHLVGRRDESMAALGDAVVRADGVENAIGLLGLKSGGEAPSGREGDLIAVQQGTLLAIESLLREAAIARGIATPQDSLKSAAEPRGAAIDSKTIPEALYWKSPATTVEPAPPPPPPGAQEIVSRYPTMECPDRVRIETEFALVVSLTESLLTPEVKVLSGPEPSLAIPVGEIDVVLAAPGFRFRDGRNTEKITVPRDGDSTPAVFHLEALHGKTSERPIYVTFWRDGGFLGKVVRKLEVVDREDAAEEPEAHARVARLSQGKPLKLQTEVEVPDLTLWIMDFSAYVEKDAIQISIQSPEFAGPMTGVFELPDGTTSWLDSQFSRFAAMSPRGLASASTPSQTPKPQATIDLMRGFGSELYKRYAPNAFKIAYWKLQEKLGKDFETIQIYSNNPQLPWELMVPSREDGSSEGYFLGTRFRVARWHVLASNDTRFMDRPPSNLEMDELVVIAPRYESPLPAQVAELQALEVLDGYRRVPAEYDAVRSLFADLPNGFVHFAGHGEVVETAGSTFQYAIRLEDGLLDLMSWRGFAKPQADRHPVYFFNACDVGQAHRVANFVDGWAPAVLESGASACIGGIWALGDRGASDFATGFYRLLDEESRSRAVPLAEIVRRTRSKFYETKDPTYLAYVYYGDANFRVLKAVR